MINFGPIDLNRRHDDCLWGFYHCTQDKINVIGGYLPGICALTVPSGNRVSITYYLPAIAVAVHKSEHRMFSFSGPHGLVGSIYILPVPLMVDYLIMHNVHTLSILWL